MTEFQSTIEEAGPIARTLRVSVSPDRVRGHLDQAYRKVQGRAQLKGFRKGKAPRPLLEKLYGEEVEREVLVELIQQGCAETIREHGLDVVAGPRLLNHAYEGEGALTFEAAVDIRPEFELGRYKGLDAEKQVVRVEDRHVDAALESLRARLAVLTTEEERATVEAGDVVVFDMFGFEGDQPVAAASGEGLLLEVGSGRFPEEFETQLVGLSRGARSPVTVTFSEEHGDEAVRGKTIRFDVTVHEIKTRVLPPIDDRLAEEAGIDGCDTLDALRDRIREDLQARAERDAERRMQNTLIGELVEAHEFAVPDSLLHDAIHGYMHEMGAELAHDSEESQKLHKALEPRARAELKAGFLLDAIAREENLAVTREELEARIRAHLAQAGRRAEEVRKHYAQPAAIVELRRNLLREKAARCVFEAASVQERQVDETQVADRG
jgi:trigger factor